ncbi:MAG TPA: discoidin domain-containing protein [Bryobacteraceae bacterium]|nr:discoidin domain-containing protein [Bryobacteraceae bacterium]
MQLFYILFGAVLTVAVSIAMGKLLLVALGLRFRREEDHIFSFVTGSACLSLLVFALAATHTARKGVFLALGVAAIGAAVAAARRRPPLIEKPLPALPRYWKILAGALFALFTYPYFFNALAPETSPDGAAYHLGLVSRYFRAHGFYRITTNMYAYLSQGTEMLYLYAFAFGRHSSTALVHFAFLLTLPMAMLAYARRFGFPVAGMVAALLVYLCPIVGFDGTTAYIDVAVACVVFVLFYLLQIWDQERTTALLIPIGLLAGFAYAMKYTAFLAVPYALGFVGWKLLRARKPFIRPLAVTAACALVMILPWVIKNWVWVDNPFAPFFNKYFPNRYVHITFEQEYRKQLENWNGVTDKWTIPVEAAVKGGKLQGVLGPVFLLFPLALLALRRKQGRQLVLAAVVFTLTYPSNIGTRFLIPMLPFLALSLGVAVENWKGAGVALVLFHALTSWPSLMTKYCDEWAMRIYQIPVRAALRLQNEEEYLRQRLGTSYEMGRLIERVVPPDSKVLCYDGPPQAYCSRDILVGYQGAFNQNMVDLLSAPLIGDWLPTRRLVFRFGARVLRRLRVVQTAGGFSESWSVNEFRVFRGDTELPRENQWRLSARPNTWEVQAAFDGNPLSRWRSWEPLFPGMWVQVDFGRPETVDRVVIDASPDHHNVQLVLEGQVQAGAPWERLAGPPEMLGVPPPANARRIATAELKWNGIEYVLIHDATELGDDIRRRAKQWGLTLIGVSGSERLYRID